MKSTIDGLYPLLVVLMELKMELCGINSFRSSLNERDVLNYTRIDLIRRKLSLSIKILVSIDQRHCWYIAVIEVKLGQSHHCNLNDSKIVQIVQNWGSNQKERLNQETINLFRSGTPLKIHTQNLNVISIISII